MRRSWGCQDICVDRTNEVVASTSSGCNIIVARQDHIPEVQRLLSAASHRAAALGYRQWWDPFPFSIVQHSVICGETYLAVEPGAVLGTLSLSWEDPLFWRERPPVSGYVHRLCTNRDVAPRGFGVEMLNWADATAADRGRDWLRLDTPASNARLRAYYENLGFLSEGRD